MFAITPRTIRSGLRRSPNSRPRRVSRWAVSGRGVVRGDRSGNSIRLCFRACEDCPSTASTRENRVVSCPNRAAEPEAAEQPVLTRSGRPPEARLTAPFRHEPGDLAVLHAEPLAGAPDDLARERRKVQSPQARREMHEHPVAMPPFPHTPRTKPGLAIPRVRLMVQPRPDAGARSHHQTYCLCPPRQPPRSG